MSKMSMASKGGGSRTGSMGGSMTSSFHRSHMQGGTCAIPPLLHPLAHNPAALQKRICAPRRKRPRARGALPPPRLTVHARLLCRETMTGAVGHKASFRSYVAPTKSYNTTGSEVRLTLCTALPRYFKF